MNKSTFLKRLRLGISALPEGEIAEHVHFFSEMICDRMEDGLSEEEAVSAVGDVDEIIARILADAPQAQAKSSSNLIAKKGSGTFIITLLVLGAPLWIPLIIAAIAVVASIYISLWSGVISLWASLAAIIGCTLAGIIAPVILALNGHVIVALAILACAIACAGVSIFFALICKWVTKGMVFLTKWPFIKLIKMFSRGRSSKI